MRLTIREKLILGTGLLLGIPIFIGAVFYLQILAIDQNMTRIIEVKEPVNAAAYEMEINAVGAGMGVLKYLDIHDPRFRKRVEEDSSEFKIFLDIYLKGASTDEEKALGERVRRLFNTYTGLGRKLMDASDRQALLFERFAGIAVKMNRLLNNGIKSGIDGDDPDGPGKLMLCLAIEIDIAHMGTWVDRYLRSANALDPEGLREYTDEFNRDLARLESLAADKGERNHIQTLGNLFKKNISHIHQLISLEDYMKKEIPVFIGFRSEIDDLLDDEIQVLTLKALSEAKSESLRLIRNTLVVMVSLFFLCLVSGIFLVHGIMKSISEPVGKLVSATDVISRGNLFQRVDIKREDELGVLARSFNRMAENLRNTMVSREYLNDIIRQMSESLVVASPDGTIESVNPATCTMLGYREDELLGRPVSMLMCGMAAPDLTGADPSATNGDIRNREHQYRRNDGETVPVLLSASFLYSADAGNRGVIYAAMDLSEQKQVEEDLRQTSEQLSLLLESLPLMVYVMENRGAYILTYVSATIRDVTGHSAGQFIENPMFWSEHIHPDDRGSFFEKFSTALEKEKLHHEYRFRSAKGKYRWFSDISRAVRGPDGAVSRIVGCCRDITEEKKLRREADLRLQQVIQSDKLASLGEVVAGVGHEINNPNSFITYNLPLMETTWQTLEPIIREYGGRHPDWRKGGLTLEEYCRDMADMIKAVKTGSERINKVVVNLKQFARMEDAPPVETVNVNRVIENTMSIIGAQVRKNAARIQLDLADALPPVRGYFQQLEQVTANLVLNAAHAVPEKPGGRITIATQYLERLGAVVVTVEDNGRGMSPDVAGQIFEPFFTTRRESGGTGLGLSVSYGLIKEHAGKIGVLSRPGAGSRFSVFLPLDRDQTLSPCPITLCVDDDAAFLDNIRAYLPDGQTMGVEAVNTFDEAMAHLADHPETDLVVYGIRLPDIDGRALCERIRETFPLVSVILYSDYPVNPESGSGGAGTRGPDHILEKPFEIDELVRSINSVERQRFV